MYSSALINRRKHDSEACFTLYTNKYNLPTSHQGRLQFTPHARVSENVKKLVVCNKPNYFCVFVIALWWWTPSNISISSCSLVINPSSNTHSIPSAILTCTRPCVTHVRLLRGSQMRAVEPAVLRYRIGASTWPLSVSTTTCDVTLCPASPVSIAAIRLK